MGLRPRAMGFRTSRRIPGWRRPARGCGSRSLCWTRLRSSRTRPGGGEPGAGDGDGGDGEGPEEESRRQPSFWKELPLLIGVALVLALIIKAFIVQAFYIPSGSMENTLQVGDRVLVNKVVYRVRDITRGDIVVFNGLDSWDPRSSTRSRRTRSARFLHNIGTAFAH